MANSSNYYRVKWSGYAEIGGERIEIAQLVITYALDSVPLAAFTPVVGRDPRTGEEQNAIDSLLDAEPYIEVKIYVKGETEEDSPQGSGTPGFKYDEDMLVFDGYYQGVRYVSGMNPAGGSVVVAGIAAGWLTGLIGTNAQTRLNTVKGPGSFAEVANVSVEGSENPVAMVNVTSAFSVAADKAVTDLWKEFIKPLFTAITETKAVWGSSDNTAAVSALDRMDDEAAFPADSADTTLSFGAVRGDVPEKAIGEWLGNSVARRVYYDWRGSTLWDALVNMGRDFLFRIVPLIETATCAPVFGALGGDPYMVIKPDEYHDVTMNAQTPEIVTKVVVVSSAAAIPGPFQAAPKIGAVIGIASCEEVWGGPVLPAAGETVRVDAPDWLAAETSVGYMTRQSLGDRINVPDAVNPDAFLVVPEEEKDYRKIYNNYLSSEIGNKFAQTIMHDVMFNTRSGTVTGRFRLDISPGSTIAVELIGGGKFSDDNEPRYVYGLVEETRITMNAGTAGGSGFASTSYRMTNIRTAQEHTGYGGYLTNDVHPLYDVAFRGTKLWTD